MTTKTRLVLACSGAPRVTAAIPLLARQHGADIVAVTLDLGDGRDLDGVRQRALEAGAIRAHVLDVREEFAREYILPALQAGVLDGIDGEVAARLARPLLARRLVEIGRIEGAAAVAHGCLAGSGDQARIETAIRALDPSVGIVAVQGSAAPAAGPAARTDVAAPDAPASVELAFQRGVPVAVNGVELSLPELLECIATIAAGHGVRTGVVQPAHRALEACVTPAGRLSGKRENGGRYMAIIDRGGWFSPERAALDEQCAALQDPVTGSVRAELFRGVCTISGVSSPFALETARA